MSDKSEQFDRAFDKDDDTLALIKRILSCFDLDLYSVGSILTGLRYIGRLWEEGEMVCECGPDSDLAKVLQDLDRNAEALVSAYNNM